MVPALCGRAGEPPPSLPGSLGVCVLGDVLVIVWWVDGLVDGFPVEFHVPFVQGDRPRLVGGHRSRRDVMARRRWSSFGRSGCVTMVSW